MPLAPRRAPRALVPLAAFAPLAALALAACHDTPSSAGAPRPAPPPIAAGEVRVALQLLDSAGGEARVAVRLEHPDVRVGAYGGTVRLDPAAIEILDAVAPAAAGGMVNARGAPGVVRFAGFDVGAVRSDVVAVLRLRVHDAAALARATTELTAVATDAGVAVRPERLRQGRGVAAPAGGAP